MNTLTGTKTKVVTRTVTGDKPPNRETAPIDAPLQ